MIVGITGATGMIGKALVLRHLERGDTVRILSRQPSSISTFPKSVLCYKADLASGAVSDLIPFVGGVDVLYHCAGETREKSRMHAVNVVGTRNLCIATHGRIGHWVQMSSVGVYGPQRSGCITEDTPLNPVDQYENTKAESEEIVRDASHEGGFLYSILRASNVYSPEMTNRSLFLLIESIYKGLFFFIGPPGASANYIHAVNVAEALILCGSGLSARGRVFNISDHVTFEAFVAVIAEALGRTSPILRLPEQPVRWFSRGLGALPRFSLSSSRIDAMTTRCIYSIDRIQNELGYDHVVSMDEGIKQLVRAWRQSN